jgi:hypothetical protein
VPIFINHVGCAGRCCCAGRPVFIILFLYMLCLQFIYALHIFYYNKIYSGSSVSLINISPRTGFFIIYLIYVLIQSFSLVQLIVPSYSYPRNAFFSSKPGSIGGRYGLPSQSILITRGRRYRSLMMRWHLARSRSVPTDGQVSTSHMILILFFSLSF